MGFDEFETKVLFHFVFSCPVWFLNPLAAGSDFVMSDGDPGRLNLKDSVMVMELNMMMVVVRMMMVMRMMMAICCNGKFVLHLMH